MDAHAVEARELVPAPIALHQQHHDAKVDPELFDLLVHGERLNVRGRVDVVREVRDAKKKCPARWCVRLGGALRYFKYIIILFRLINALAIF